MQGSENVCELRRIGRWGFRPGLRITPGARVEQQLGNSNRKYRSNQANEHFDANV
jgi:hypothetical protein